MALMICVGIECVMVVQDNKEVQKHKLSVQLPASAGHVASDATFNRMTLLGSPMHAQKQGERMQKRALGQAVEERRERSYLRVQALWMQARKSLALHIQGQLGQAALPKQPNIQKLNRPMGQPGHCRWLNLCGAPYNPVGYYYPLTQDEKDSSIHFKYSLLEKSTNTMASYDQTWRVKNHESFNDVCDSFGDALYMSVVTNLDQAG